MRKLLTFIPLGIGISAAIIYVFNIIQFRVINNSATLIQILSNLKIYLYISIAGFLTYFFVKLILLLNDKKDYEVTYDDDEEDIKELHATMTEPIVKKVIIKGDKYCTNCGENIFDTDIYCKSCGTYQKDKKTGISKLIRNIINIIEIVILILVLYFSVNMLFEYKEKQDPNFKSPLKIDMVK